jgi:hypothetical protein
VQVNQILDCVIEQVDAGTGTGSDTSKKAAAGASDTAKARAK